MGNQPVCSVSIECRIEVYEVSPAGCASEVDEKSDSSGVSPAAAAGQPWARMRAIAAVEKRASGAPIGRPLTRSGPAGADLCAILTGKAATASAEWLALVLTGSPLYHQQQQKKRLTPLFSVHSLTRECMYIRTPYLFFPLTRAADGSCLIATHASFVVLKFGDNNFSAHNVRSCVFITRFISAA